MRSLLMPALLAATLIGCADIAPPPTSVNEAAETALIADQVRRCDKARNTVAEKYALAPFGVFTRAELEELNRLRLELLGLCGKAFPLPSDLTEIESINNQVERIQ